MTTPTAIAKTTTGGDPENNIVDPNSLQFRRAVKDSDEAYSICKRLNSDNTQRNQKNAAIMRKFNDEQPYPQDKLKAAGQNWRNNRPTGFMSSMVKRALPPYMQSIDSARVLTSASLKGEGPDVEQKNEYFREEFTKTVRRWKGWHNFTYQLTLEDLLFGYQATCWMDEYDWHPTHCRGDEAFFPNGCPQEASEVPLWARYQCFMIHELADKLVDPESSSAVGWNIDNLVEAINNSQPKKDGMSRTPGQERKYEDTVRESTMGRSYSEGVKVVETYTLFVREPTGKVSQYMVEARDGKELMVCPDRFDSMEDCLSLMTIEVGNGKLHGSKGAGRILYNTHVAADQARNLVADNLYLAGLILLKGSTKGMKGAAITVIHPVAIVNEQFEVQDATFKVNVEAFFSLDQHLTRIAELQVGAFMPGQMLNSEGDKPTASEVNYVASVEQQIREGVLARFYGQFLNISYVMQRRMFSQDNIAEAFDLYLEKRAGKIIRVARKMIDFIKRISIAIARQPIPLAAEKNYQNPEAVYACLSLLEKGLTPEEIYELGQCPPNEVTDEMTNQRAVALDSVVTRYANNPRVRQTPLIQKDIASKLGNTVAEELIIPEEDNTVTAEAVRLQLMELQAITGGDEIPVSPRDVDIIHMQTIQQKAGQMLTELSPQNITPETLKIADGVLTHFEGHIQGALMKGAKPDQLKAQIELAKKIRGVIQQLGAGMNGMPQNGLQIPAGATPTAPSSPAGPGAPPPPGGAPLPPTPVLPSDKMPFTEGPQNLQPAVSPQ